MRAPKVLAAALMLLVAGIILSPARAVSEIHEEILTIYSFQPHLLSKAEIDQKSAVLDKFWSKAEGDPDRYVRGLREELAEKKNPPFFFYDGSKLLLKMSDTPQDHKIALNAIARCDLRDIEQSDYFYQVHRLANAGEDTTAAAFHVLEDPSFKVVVPQHVLILGQDFSLIYMLMPTDPRFWLRAAIERVAHEKDRKAQQSLLLLLWYAQDDAADQAIHTISQDAIQSADIRKTAHDLEDRNHQIRVSVRKRPSEARASELRSRRREVMSRVSDEALTEFDELTVQLAAMRNH